MYLSKIHCERQKLSFGECTARVKLELTDFRYAIRKCTRSNVKLQIEQFYYRYITENSTHVKYIYIGTLYF